MSVIAWDGQSFAADRQRFLAEQGYAYTTVGAGEVIGGPD